jgi:superfamily II DNA/RNA helicase
MEELQHPKIKKLLSIIDEEINDYDNKKMIIFTQYREMAEFLKSNIRGNYKMDLVVEKFIGQSSKINDIGFSQDKQIKILQEFRDNKINILIATSVAEEGLDIPNVDAIIFYEPVPSEIRLIQRRGRTGRFASGRCYILMTRGTVDVPYYKVSRKKELTMKSVLLENKQLNLCKTLNRRKIDFNQLNINLKDDKCIRDIKKRKRREKQSMVKRSIDEILTEIDNFIASEEYKTYKACGVTFYSDLVNLNTSKLQESISKLKGVKKLHPKQKKRYLNRNLKTLINLVKINHVNGKMELSSLKQLARKEDILEDKFHTHFNRACYLGYLKKNDNTVELLSDYK